MSFCDAVLDIAYIVDASAVDHRTPEQHAACPGGWLAAAPRDGALAGTGRGLRGHRTHTVVDILFHFF